VAKELIESLRRSREAGEDPGVGRTEKPVTGFRSRAGRTFRAKLRMEQTDESKWRVEFDEDWAKEPPAGESEEERAEAEVGGRPAEAGDGAAARTAATAEAGDGAGAKTAASADGPEPAEPEAAPAA
jgi:DNA topoisomerase-3